ncbi:MAG TPA: hypothetical protein VIN10_08920 [Bacteroidales bacterium]
MITIKETKKKILGIVEICAEQFDSYKKQIATKPSIADWCMFVTCNINWII